MVPVLRSALLVVPLHLLYPEHRQCGGDAHSARYIFGFIPAADALFGEDRHNPPAEVVAAMEADHYYMKLARATA